MKARWYVYTLTDPRNGEIFYVGKGTGDRMESHGTPNDDTNSAKRTRLRDLGERVIRTKVAEFWDEAAALACESQWIEDHRTTLTNVGCEKYVENQGIAPQRLLNESFIAFTMRCVHWITETEVIPPNEAEEVFKTLLLAAWYTQVTEPTDGTHRYDFYGPVRTHIAHAMDLDCMAPYRGTYEISAHAT